MATAFVTFGASVAAQAAIFVARKAALKMASNVLIEQIIGQISGVIMDPLMGVAEPAMQALLDAPVTKNLVGDPSEFTADLGALDQAAAAMDQNSADMGTVGQEYAVKIQALEIFTGM